MAFVVAHATGSRPERTRMPRTYTCSMCDRSFKRSEHCIRHERGHTKERPFPCAFCGRKYARKDLVSRHQRSFHPLGEAEIKPKDNRCVIEDDKQQEKPEGTEQIGPENALPLPNSTRTGSSQGISPGENEGSIIETPSSSHSSHDTTEGLAFAHNGQNHGFGVEIDTAIEFPSIELQLPDFPSTSHTKRPRTQRIDSVESVKEKQTQKSVDTRNQYTLQETQMQANSMHDLQTSEDLTATSGNGSGFMSTNQQNQWNAFSDGTFQHLTDRPIYPGATSSPGFNTNSGMLDIDFFSLPTLDDQHFGMGHAMSESLFNTVDGTNKPNGTQGFTLVPLVNQIPSPASSDSSRPQYPLLLHLGNGPKPTESILGLDSDTYIAILGEIQAHIPPSEKVSLPNLGQLQQFINSYTKCFHSHYPILHLPSVTSEPPYPPLLLAISAIGALYRLKRGAAWQLWAYAQVLIEPEFQKKKSTSQLPIQAVQARLLLTMFAVFGGNVKEAVNSMEIVGFWVREYGLRRAAFASQNADGFLSWSEWSSRETSKRLLCGIFVLSSLLTVTYDTSPFISITQDLNIPLPEPEPRWEATSAQEWAEVQYDPDTAETFTIREVMVHLFFNNVTGTSRVSTENRSIWSGFATTVVMHAVIVQMWNTMQCTQAFTNFPIENFPIGQHMVNEVEQALARCYSLVNKYQSEISESADPSQRPQMFTCQALLRSAYVRIFTGAGSFDRMMLLNENEGQVINSIQAFVQVPQRRNHFLTKAVQKAYDGLLMPITAGYLLVRKTAALSWSVEHAIAAWDCALFVTKWIHGLETRQDPANNPLNPAEIENLQNFKILIAEVETDFDSIGSLAADVANVWACFLDDTWVWGITPRMGHLLRLLSREYAEDWKRNNGNGDGTMERDDFSFDGS